MCNISGYVGTQQAAPILIDMIKRQEGFAGGYYTGIATIHEGKLYYAKLTGDTKQLIEQTNAINFPGTIGIIHSRSASGGGDNWAHPFIGKADGKDVLAYVANGNSGVFTHRNEEYATIAQQLSSEGFEMLPGENVEEKSYPLIGDGTRVHMSDIMCQLITKYMVSGMDSVAAMERAYCEMPGEIVGLLLSLANPDCIVWSRINRPMMLGFSSHGAYLSTTAMAFPEDAGEPIALPACTSGRVYKDHMETFPYQQNPAYVEEIDACINEQAYQMVVGALKERELLFIDIERMIKALYGSNKCVPYGLMGYEILRALKTRGQLKTITISVPGVEEGLVAPETRVSFCHVKRPFVS